MCSDTIAGGSDTDEWTLLRTNNNDDDDDDNNTYYNTLHTDYDDSVRSHNTHTLETKFVEWLSASNYPTMGLVRYLVTMMT